MVAARSNLPRLLRAYLFLGSFVLVAAAFAYSYSWVRKVNQESQAISQLLARFIAVSALQATENPDLREIFTNVIRPSDLPLVLTDRAGRPFVWSNIGVDPGAIGVDTISQWDPSTPPRPALKRILDRVAELDRVNPPIPIYTSDHTRPFGLVHFGERRLASELRYIPMVQLAVIAIFVALGYASYRSIKTSEQRAIWIGLAKETAHQLGSPISSMMGWIEILRERVIEAEGLPEAPSPREITLTTEFLTEILDEMEDDADRLNKVAKRFSQVGSAQNLVTADVVPIVSAAVRYFRRRLPHLKKEIEIDEAYEMVPPVSLNEELIEWVVENILKNAIDATRTKGTIRVSVVHRHATECVEVRIADEGRGMTSAEVRQIFAPGFTTKSRGWGLGLTLAKRIVEENHGGRIWVEKTEPGRGTTFVISFPV
jgi:two-component system, NtrC family, sensor histidine kinase KinB